MVVSPESTVAHAVGCLNQYSFPSPSSLPPPNMQLESRLRLLPTSFAARGGHVTQLWRMTCKQKFEKKRVVRENFCGLMKCRGVAGAKSFLHSSCFERTWLEKPQKPAYNHVLTSIKMKASPGGMTEKRNRTKVSGGISDHRNSSNCQPLDFWLFGEKKCLFI